MGGLSHISRGMQKARITVVRCPPSYEVWVEQGGRRHLFAIAGSFEDAQAEAAEEERIRI
jgi:hypothetical protein